MVRQKFNILKVSSEKSPKNVVQSFPTMPRMYLELIENKLKVKPDLINKDYIPVYGEDSKYNPQDYTKKTMYKSDHSGTSDYEDDSKYNKLVEEYTNLKKELDRVTDSEKDNSDINDSDKEDHKENYKQKHDKDYDLSDKDQENDNNSEDDVKRRLKSLLNDTSDDDRGNYRRNDREDYKRHDSPDYTPDTYRNNKYSKHRSRILDYNREPTEHFHKGLPPTLTELENTGQYARKKEYRDINNIYTDEYEEEDEKRELLFKFDILKKKYKESNIPEYTIHTDLHTMKKEYESKVKTLTLDSNVDTYKKYLIHAFMLVELVLGKFLGFDMEGYTQQQIISINSYEKLLIELGEKSYVPTGSKYPVELRLLFLIIINTGFFLVGKMIIKNTGADIFNSINSVNSNISRNTNSKRRMKGPDIDLNEIPDVNE